MQRDWLLDKHTNGSSMFENTKKDNYQCNYDYTYSGNLYNTTDKNAVLYIFPVLAQGERTL